MNYFVYVKDILGVKTNADSFKWSYGTVAPRSDEAEFERCLIKVYLEVIDSKDVFDDSIRMKDKSIGQYHYFFGKRNDSKIYYERDFFFNSKLKYVIEVVDNNIYVKVNHNYYRFISHRFMNLHSIGYILTDLVSGMLLNNGLATIHCSAVNIGNRTFVLFAPPNTGKTLTAMRLCEIDAAKFVAEDFAITDGDNIYSVPWTSTFRYYDEINKSKLDQLVNEFKKRLPVLELIPIGKRWSIDEYIGWHRMIYKIEITDVVLLERGKTEIINTKEGVLHKITNLNKYEFNYHKSPAVLALNYFNPQLSPDKMYDAEKAILKKLINNHSVNIVVSDNALNYSNLVLTNLLG